MDRNEVEKVRDLGGPNTTGSIFQPTAHLSAAFTPDDKTFAAACYGGVIRFWDIESLTTHEWNAGSGAADAGYVQRAITISPDGQTVAVTHGASEHGIALHDLADGSLHRVIGKWNIARRIAFFCVGLIGWSYVWSRTRAGSQLPRTHAQDAEEPETTTTFQLGAFALSLVVLTVGVVLMVSTVAVALSPETDMRQGLSQTAAVCVLLLGTILCCRGFIRLKSVF